MFTNPEKQFGKPCHTPWARMPLVLVLMLVGACSSTDNQRLITEDAMDKAVEQQREQGAATKAVQRLYPLHLQ